MHLAIVLHCLFEGDIDSQITVEGSVPSHLGGIRLN